MDGLAHHVSVGIGKKPGEQRIETVRQLAEQPGGFHPVTQAFFSCFVNHRVQDIPRGFQVPGLAVAVARLERRLCRPPPKEWRWPSGALLVRNDSAKPVSPDAQLFAVPLQKGTEHKECPWDRMRKDWWPEGP